MSEDKDLALALEPVKSYIHGVLGLKNSFTSYLDKERRYFKSDYERGKIDYKNSKILINAAGLTSFEGGTELTPEYAASVFAHFQPVAFLYEMARNKQLKRPPEHVKEVAKQSMVLLGICKKVELDTGRRLQAVHGFRFSEIEEDVMRLMMSDEKIDALKEVDLENLGMTKLELRTSNRGFRWYDQLQQKARGHRMENDVLRASLLVAIEADNFNERYQALLDYDIDDIFVHAGFIVKRKVSVDAEKIEREMKETRELMGGQEQGRKIKGKLENMGHMLDHAGVKPSTMKAYREMQEKVGRQMSDLEPPREMDRILINDLLRLIETNYLNQVKGKGPETRDVD